MDPRALVQPLEPRWQDVLDDVLRDGRPPLTTKDVGRLAPKLVELSRAYNSALAEGRRTKLPLEPRVAFSFPRDVPKGAAAVRELVASGVLALSDRRALRVLDLGAGLGAMTWGLVRALAASGAAGRVEALLVDEDERALGAAQQIERRARAAFGPGPVELTMRTRVASLGDAKAGASRELRGPADVVLLGQVLSEMDLRASAEERVARQADLVADLLEAAVADDGALVVVEPALQARTRHLHALRDHVLASAKTRATVFAPCLHAAPCPALASETDWCHEDLRVDLPEWLVPLARAAGLRWQGLTFSYLVLRKDGRRAVAGLSHAQRSLRFRAVSDVLRTKGKREVFTCSESGVRAKVRLLDRDALAPTGGRFEDIERGDIVTLSAPPEDDLAASGRDLPGAVDDRGRVRAGSHLGVELRDGGAGVPSRREGD